jgi:putative lumazine-binding protein
VMRNLFCVALLIAAAAPATAADSNDIQSTVDAVYNVISGPAGPRDWDRFKALFAPDAHLASSRDGKVSVMTPDDYIARAKPHFEQGGFFERSVENHIDQFKDIAHVTSRYESRHAQGDEKPFARGVNHFELVRIGDRWRVLSIVWQQE